MFFMRKDQKVRDYIVSLVKNANEQGEHAKVAYIKKCLKNKYQLNDNQISGLLNKMSTNEKLLIRVERGLYDLYENKKSDNNFIELIDLNKKIMVEIRGILLNKLNEITIDELEYLKKNYDESKFNIEKFKSFLEREE